MASPLAAYISPSQDDVYGSTHFAEHDPRVIESLIRTFPLGIIVAVSPDDGLAYAASAPLVFEGPHSATIVGHFARANPHWERCCRAREVLVVFTGHDAYVSPSWYLEKGDTGRVVPTWNYSSVHLRGLFELVAPSDAQSQGQTTEARAVLDSLTNASESYREKPWKVGDAPQSYVNALQREIIAFRITPRRISAISKHSQNKTCAVQREVAEGMRRDSLLADAPAAAAIKAACANDVEQTGARRHKL